MFEFLKKMQSLINSLFKGRKSVTLGIYGAPNTGKTTLANKISMDWTGEPVGIVSKIPHETRQVQKKEKVEIKQNGKELVMNILDMPGIATKVDYREFTHFGLTKKKAKERAREATKGVIEAIKWLDHVDVVLVVMDATADPYTQVNATIIGNLEARKIPVIIVANKIDLRKAKPKAIRDAFPQHTVVPISAMTGKNIAGLYETIFKVSR